MPDRKRLNAQQKRVFNVMKDGKWRTLAEVAIEIADSEASISARLRDLRKEEFGGFIVDRQHRSGAETGLFEYRLVVNRELYSECLVDVAPQQVKALPDSRNLREKALTQRIEQLRKERRKVRVEQG